MTDVTAVERTDQHVDRRVDVRFWWQLSVANCSLECVGEQRAAGPDKAGAKPLKELRVAVLLHKQCSEQRHRVLAFEIRPEVLEHGEYLLPRTSSRGRPERLDPKRVHDRNGQGGFVDVSAAETRDSGAGLASDRFQRHPCIASLSQLSLCRNKDRRVKPRITRSTGAARGTRGARAGCRRWSHRLHYDDLSK